MPVLADPEAVPDADVNVLTHGASPPVGRHPGEPPFNDMPHRSYMSALTGLGTLTG
jgi:hypothetical protein